MQMTDQEVLKTLAEGFLRGDLQLQAEPTNAWPCMPSSSSAQSSSSAVAVESAPVVNLNALPDPPLVPPILPVLEEVGIDTAEVLPEVDQTLEQIAAAQATMEKASVSMAPAPTKVPLIGQAMAEAGDAVTQALDGM